MRASPSSLSQRASHTSSASRHLVFPDEFAEHLTWAKEKKNWTVAQWYKVLFSDKSKFCISKLLKCLTVHVVNVKYIYESFPF